LRVSGVVSEYGNNFIKTILRLAQEKNELRIVADQITCPTDAVDIADALFSIINKLRTWGTYHYCSAAPVSWHQFALAIVAEARSSLPLLVNEIHAITTAEYPTAAKRPAYSVLECSKIQQTFGITRPSWQMAVKRVVAKLIQET
jgi:dTDP-4-dehydrorhamnose reductase